MDFFMEFLSLTFIEFLMHFLRLTVEFLSVTRKKLTVKIRVPPADCGDACRVNSTLEATPGSALQTLTLSIRHKKTASFPPLSLI
jgi:hypothetical protein